MLWSLNTNCKNMKVVQHLPHKLMTSGSYQLCFAKAQENLQVFPVSGYPRRYAPLPRESRLAIVNTWHPSRYGSRFHLARCSSLTSCQQLNTLCNKALLLQPQNGAPGAESSTSESSAVGCDVREETRGEQRMMGWEGLSKGHFAISTAWQLHLKPQCCED